MIGDVLQPTHLIFILVVALLVLGPKRLPEVGRSLGKGIRDFRGALSGMNDDLHAEPESASALPAENAPITPATVVPPDEAAAPEPVGVVPAHPVVDGVVEPVDGSGAGRVSGPSAPAGS